MKNNADQSFEALVRAKLSDIQTPLPPEGLAAIRQQLAARKRKRRILMLLSLELLLSTSVVLFVLFSTPQNQSASLAQLTEPDKAEQSTNSENKPSLQSEDYSIHITPIIKEKDHAPLLNQEPPQKKFNKTFLKNQTSHIPFSDSSLNAITPPINVPEKNHPPIDRTTTPDKEVMAISNDLQSDIIPLLEEKPDKAVNYEHDYSPVFSFFHSMEKMEKSWFWKLSLTPGLHFYHLQPNKTDEIHFYSFDNSGTDWTIQTGISLNHLLSDRLSVGVQAQYLFTQTSIRISSIEKEAGQVALIKRNANDEFYRDYRGRSDLIEGSFHQLGIGGRVTYDLLLLKQTSVRAAVEFTYLTTLNNNGNSLFPEQGLGMSFGLNWEQPLGKKWKLGIQPNFTYITSLDGAQDWLTVNRMIFGVGVRLNAH